MIKKITIIFFALIFFLIKKIFVKENRVPHKIMDSFANKLHSIFIFTSFPALYISLFELSFKGVYVNTYIYIALLLQFILIIRYFNKEMLEQKSLQVKMMRQINRVSFILFIANWIAVSFLFSLSFMLITFVNYSFYIFIFAQINKQKEQAEFKKQFGEGNYSKGDILKKHILNLFESDLDEKSLTRSDIKKQYRTMAKKYHPDVYKGNEKDKFTSINLSYNFLLDFVK